MNFKSLITVNTHKDMNQGGTRSLVRRGLIASLGVVAIISLAISCTSTPKKQRAPGERVSIMSFNVENLFDTEHDEGTKDFTYLPLGRKMDKKIREGCMANDSEYRRRECLDTDWDVPSLKKKLERLKAVVRQVNEGRGADVLTLPEVENQRVLDLLVEEINASLPDNAKYVTAKLIDSFDPRGIDPAIVSRFPMWREPKIHRIPMKALDTAGEYGAKFTRGILEVPITLPDGTQAIVYSLHFPSQGNPSYLRQQAVEFLNVLEKELPPQILAIAGGDFNITRAEDNEKGYYRQILNERWQVAHIEGCKACDGTHYYHPKTEWSFLDSILIRRASIETTGWRLDPESVAVPNEHRYQVNHYGSPARFDARSGIGVSDHYPIYAELLKPPRPAPVLSASPTSQDASAAPSAVIPASTPTSTPNLPLAKPTPKP